MTQTTFHPSDQSRLMGRVHKTRLDGLYYLEAAVHPDQRGFYSEVAIVAELDQVLDQPFVIKQINLSHSVTNVTRGFHAENWFKLVTVISGTAFCAIADIRPQSTTYKQVETFLLGQAEPALPGCLFVSAGLANSVCVVDGPVDYLYGVNQLYKDRDTSGDRAISIFDPELNVTWPIDKAQMILSDRDRTAITLKELYPES